MRARGKIAWRENMVRLVDPAMRADVWSNRQYWYRRMPKDFFRYRTKDDFPESPTAMSPEHDQVDFPLARALQEALGYWPFQHANVKVLVPAEFSHVSQPRL